MSLRRFVSVPTFLSVAVLCAMGIILSGGCPQQQVPSPPQAQEEDNTSDLSGPEQTDPGRPIPGPTIDIPDEPVQPDPDDDGDKQQPDKDIGDGGTSTVSVRFNAPLNPTAVRPGTKVDLVFKLSDRQGIVTKAELVVARDDNQDGVPDGGPLAPKTISASPGSNTIPYDSNEAVPLLQAGGFGRFLLGVRISTSFGEKETSYASGTVTIDAVAPTATWVFPTGNRLANPQNWAMRVRTTDNSKHTVRLLLDNDTNPSNGYAAILVNDTEFDAGTATREFNPLLSVSAGTYYYYAIVSDGIDPPTAFYAPNLDLGGSELAQILITKRRVGTFDLNRLDPQSPQYDNWGAQSMGTILQGFNFADLAGSAMTGVPDLTGDGLAELVIASRFGKPRVQGEQGVGWGEGYLVLGRQSRLREPKRLNAVGVLGGPGIDGLIFAGIRAPRTTTWSEGLSDVTYVPDMDGDGRPELVFSFPRVESVSLRNGIWQHPELGPYHAGMGSLEYDPAADVADTIDIEDPLNPGQYLLRRADYEVQLDGFTWLKNRAQFTRGGIVIVSSSNTMYRSTTQLNAKGDRVIDLHEVGQCFNNTERPEVRPLIEGTAEGQGQAMCGDPPELTDYDVVLVRWDAIFRRQGPAGFGNWQTDFAYWDPINPPMANMWPGISMSQINAAWLTPLIDPCDDGGLVGNDWLSFTPCNAVNTGTGSQYFPPGSDPLTDIGYMIHTGFYGRGGAEQVSPWGGTVGARVLGQRVNGRFGMSVSSDDTWLYISAPEHSALQSDVPSLGSEPIRTKSGAVYQYRVNSPAWVGGPTRSQLWIEAGTRRILDPELQDPDPEDPESWIDTPLTWPFCDEQRLGDDMNTEDDHRDYAMPVPHTYIIEDVGSDRGRDYFWEDEWYRIFGAGSEFIEETRFVEYPLTAPGSAGAQLQETTVEAAVRAVAPCDSDEWPSGGIGTSTWYVNRTPQIVGPHADAEVSAVRAIGDVDADSVGDFAVGSAHVRSDIVNGIGDEVGAVFVVFGRPPGLEGDYLLERLALPTNDSDRLAGVVLKGNPAGTDRLARVFDGAGRFNADVYEDVAIGNETGSGGKGEVIMLLGSQELQSPGGGWTIDQAVSAGVAIRIVGESVGDAAGASVAGAGDVDGDGYGDILIGAPGAQGGKGVVYLIYGSARMYGGQTISLSLIGTFDLPGAKFIGRKVGDALGGGSLTFGDQVAGNPNGNIYLNPNAAPVTVYSDGVVGIGDIDGDGKSDFALSSMLADPLGRRDAGEVYVIYGSGD